MSRKVSAVQIESDSESDVGEEAFDDDTDLPLPTAAKPALPNLGPRGALLEEIRPGVGPTPAAQTSSSQPVAAAGTPGPATSAGLLDPSHPLYQQFAAANNAAGGGRSPVLVDVDSPESQKFKNWTCVYPIYIDAKRAYGTGQRRIAREKSIWWPRSQDILVACASFKLPVAHEPQAFHPRDWENPGRVKVLWKDGGQLTNPNIPTKKKLFEMIAAYIQGAKPEQVPDMASLSLNDDKDQEIVSTHAPPPNAKPKPGTKGKSSKQPASSIRTPKHRVPRLPKPPRPLPPFQDRYSMYSPLIPSGSLLEGWKIGASPPVGQEKGVAGAPGAAATVGGGGKGKRKVIKIRM